MWDKLTEEKCAWWNEKAKQVGIAGDQSRLIVALPMLFKALAAAGHIGPLEAMVLFSYCEEQQVLRIGHARFSVGSSGQNYRVETGKEQFDKLFVHCFHKWASEALPAVKRGEVERCLNISARFFDQDMGSSIQWEQDSLEKINTELLSFYDKQKFKLPFPLSDPWAMSRGKAMALAEHFQEQGQCTVSPAVSQSNTSISEHKASAHPPATVSIASTSGSAVTPAHPIPSALTEGSKDTTTSMATATTPTNGSTSGSECALTPVDAMANGSTGGSNAATTPVATGSSEFTPEAKHTITPAAIPYPSMLGRRHMGLIRLPSSSPHLTIHCSLKGHDCIGRKLHHHHYADEETLGDAATDEESIASSENCPSTVERNSPSIMSISQATHWADTEPLGPNTSIPPPCVMKPLDQAAGSDSDDEVLALDDLEAADIRRAIELSLADLPTVSQSSMLGARPSSSRAVPPPLPPHHTRPRTQPPSTIPVIRARSDSPELSIHYVVPSNGLIRQSVRWRLELDIIHPSPQNLDELISSLCPLPHINHIQLRGQGDISNATAARALLDALVTFYGYPLQSQPQVNVRLPSTHDELASTMLVNLGLACGPGLPPAVITAGIVEMMNDPMWSSVGDEGLQFLALDGLQSPKSLATAKAFQKKLTFPRYMSLFLDHSAPPCNGPPPGFQLHDPYAHS
ncbi:hypothetical protein BT96DRAFT_997280 [Gymnopus androsaceus JB14]|uniref:Uncharacterized protein n=1 Tax=Gymnopus androsaceus JB14 TaxID=1447944 RepID=A0A6A4HD55_9AGAR|nr:hypothetical protein BT96DRAFT_997280 [Gymnopus androsaceus JB14]